MHRVFYDEHILILLGEPTDCLLLSYVYSDITTKPWKRGEAEKEREGQGRLAIPILVRFRRRWLR